MISRRSVLAAAIGLVVPAPKMLANPITFPAPSGDWGTLKFATCTPGVATCHGSLEVVFGDRAVYEDYVSGNNAFDILWIG